MLKKCQSHLDHAHENYFQHLAWAAWFGLRVMATGIACVLHAICPAIFQCTTSTNLNKLHAEMQARMQKTGIHHHHG